MNQSAAASDFVTELGPHTLQGLDMASFLVIAYSLLHPSLSGALIGSYGSSSQASASSEESATQTF